ncbi:MAG: ATP-binding cassette domain-containing protein [Christensenellaceae bacterium]|jgi:ABC-type lipoprotein export system ATPase subunit/ABC-type antimicrobial peptide transport system permease subunit|nr:ATP-binding cassette domain-containing protein [Christensenellaceae bacterium]
MIDIKNITHKYKPKNGSVVNAVSDLSLTLPNTGMVFITGKSGSGKTTLLNLLGGLDVIQEGDIFIDGASLAKFSSLQLNSYRNTYAGMIFQEFNLLEDFTVYENIDLPLNLQGNKDCENDIASALKLVDLEGYENRKIKELSGGEKQRIAIARQLAKGSKLILADEPTGNLDESNGRMILNKLKELSNNILVVVVSHDIDFANEYADIIVKLSDGKLSEILEVSTNINMNGAEHQALPYTKSLLSNRYALKLAYKNIKRKSVRFAIALLLTIISLTFFAVFRAFAIYDAEKLLANAIIKNNDPYTIFVQGYADSATSVSRSGTSLNIAHAYYMSEFANDSENIKTYHLKTRFAHNYTRPDDDHYAYHSYLVSVVKDRDSLLDILGFTFKEERSNLTNDSVYITDYYLDGLLYSGNYMYVDGQIIDINTQEICLDIAGVLKTNYKEHIPTPEEEQVLNYDLYYQITQAWKMYRDEILNTIYCNQNYASNLIKQTNYVSVYNEIKLYANDKHISGNISNNIGAHGYDFNVTKHVLTNNSVIDATDGYTLDDNSAIISLVLYNNIFNEYKTQNYYATYDGAQDEREITVKNYPTHVGKKVSFSIKDEDGTVILTLKDVKIAGVLFEADIIYFPTYEESDTYIDAKNFEKIMLATTTPFRITIKTPEKASELTKLIKKYDEELIFAHTVYSNKIYELEGTFGMVKFIIVGASGLLLLIAILIFANFTAASITDSRKNIGIIRSVGGSASNIFKIYITEGLIGVILASVISLVLVAIGIFISNQVMYKVYATNTQILLFDYLSILMIPAIALGSMVISALIPIRKAIKMSPIEAIKN